jgi:phytoene/squalene synthetase
MHALHWILPTFATAVVAAPAEQAENSEKIYRWIKRDEDAVDSADGEKIYRWIKRDEDAADGEKIYR